MFKKRHNLSNIRKRDEIDNVNIVNNSNNLNKIDTNDIKFNDTIDNNSNSNNEKDNDDNNDNDENKLLLLRKVTEQNLRKKQKGISTDILLKSHIEKVNENNIINKIKIIENNSNSHTNLYDNLMVKYVEDKLQNENLIINSNNIVTDEVIVNNNNNNKKLLDSKSLVLHSLLESHNINNNNVINNKNKTDFINSKLTEEQKYIGLTVVLNEVILPDKYKTKNINDTTKVITKLTDNINDNSNNNYKYSSAYTGKATVLPQSNVQLNTRFSKPY